MSFKQDFEKTMNKELQEDHMDPPPAIDIEMQHQHQQQPGPPPPPMTIFPSYPAAPQARSGVYVPAPLFALFAAIFLFESGILFVYTVVALWNTLPGTIKPVVIPPATCNCPAAVPQMMVAPNGWVSPPPMPQTCLFFLRLEIFQARTD